LRPIQPVSSGPTVLWRHTFCLAYWLHTQFSLTRFVSGRMVRSRIFGDLRRLYMTLRTTDEKWNEH
jgi:hypothetical protein